MRNEDQSSRVSGAVGVIVATHDRPMMLEGAINNILSQSYSNVQILVVDNGEATDTEAVARAVTHIDSRVKYVKYTLRRGAAAARNFGLFSLDQRVSGVFFLDDDDRFSDSDSLGQLVKSHQGNSDRLMTYGIQRDVNTDGSLYQVWPCRKSRLTDMILDTHKIQFPAHTVLWNAAFARSLGGYSWRFENDMEDIAFIERGLAALRSDADKIHYIDAPIVDWRRGSDKEDTLHSRVRRNAHMKHRVRQELKKVILRHSGYNS